MSGPEKEQPKNAIEIIQEYLERNGFDGLYADSGFCWCDIKEFAELCKCPDGDCSPGYKNSAGHIGPREDKPE